MKKILLTRSKEDNEILAQILKNNGHIHIDFSLIHHHATPINITIIDDYTHIIVTSKRAADLLPLANGPKDAWVVGHTSAEILYEKNYNIRYIASSAQELKEQIPEDIYPNTIYLSGNVISERISSKIKIVEIYKVKYKEDLSKEEIESIKSGVDYILVYSENCAKTLIRLITKNDLLKYLENTVVIAISSKVEKILKSYFKNTIACTNPDQILDKIE